MRLKIILFFVLVTLASVSHSQTQQGSFNTDNFPVVSFVWNDYDSEIKDKSCFKVYEDEKQVQFDYKLLEDSIVPKGKTILFLWEDVPTTNPQFSFSVEFFKKFFEDYSIHPDDKFNIGFFSKKRITNSENAIHSFLCDEFVSSKDSLIAKINNYRPNANTVLKDVNSDIYFSIDEAIELLKKQGDDNIKSVVLVSKGVNYRGVGGKNDTDDCLSEALKSKITVSFIEYNSRQSNLSTTIIKRSFGEHIKTTNYESASQKFTNYCNNVNKIHCGNSYQLSFKSSKKRDKQTYPINLIVSNKTYTLYYSTPAFSLAYWIKENLFLFIGLVVLLLAFFLLSMFLSIQKNKKRKRKNQQEKAEIEKKQNEIKAEAERNKQALIDYQTKQEKEQIELKKEQELVRLKNLMNSKNLYPRLSCKIGDNVFDYVINNPVVNLGRNSNNEVVLNAKTVSSFHAIIKFTGSDFEIYDNNSTNKVIVNGQIVKETILRNSDIIGLGDALITFYL